MKVEVTARYCSTLLVLMSPQLRVSAIRVRNHAVMIMNLHLYAHYKPISVQSFLARDWLNFVFGFIIGTETVDLSVSAHFHYWPKTGIYCFVSFSAETKVAFLPQSEAKRIEKLLFLA